MPLKNRNISISRIFFWPNFIFCNFKNDQKSIFELRKSLKLPKVQFHEKIIFDLFDFASFFAWTFLNFLAHCVIVNKQLILPDEVSMSRIKDANVYFMIADSLPIQWALGSPAIIDQGFAYLMVLILAVSK